MFVYFSVCYLIVLISFGTNSRWYFNKCKRIERVIIGLILLNLIQNYNCQTTNTTNVNVSVMTSHVRPRRSDDMWKDQVTVSSNWPSDFITQRPFVSIHNTSIHNTSQRSKDNTQSCIPNLKLKSSSQKLQAVKARNYDDFIKMCYSLLDICGPFYQNTYLHACTRWYIYYEPITKSLRFPVLSSSRRCLNYRNRLKGIVISSEHTNSPCKIIDIIDIYFIKFNNFRRPTTRL